jgi:hypothetical protein
MTNAVIPSSKDELIFSKAEFSSFLLINKKLLTFLLLFRFTKVFLFYFIFLYNDDPPRAYKGKSVYKKNCLTT